MDPFPHQLTCSFDRHLSSTHHVPGTVLGAGDTGVNQEEKVLLSGAYIPRVEGRQWTLQQSVSKCVWEPEDTVRKQSRGDGGG